MKRICLVLLCLLWLPVVVHAQAPKKTPSTSEPKAANLLDYRKDLGLSDDQVTQLHALVDHLDEEFRQGNEKHRALNHELDQLVSSGAETALLKAKLEEDEAVVVELRLADLEAARTIQTKILTPEQWQKWQAILVKLRGHGRPVALPPSPSPSPAPSSSASPLEGQPPSSP